MAKNVLITGATGFIGRHVVSEFLQAGYNVTATDIHAPSIKVGSYRFVESDITRREGLDELVKGQGVIVNVAGLVDLSANASLLDAVNHAGVRNLCRAARIDGNVTKLVQVSSIGVYGKNEKVPICEDDVKIPSNNYEISKWRGETAAFEYSLDFAVTAVRPSTVYGVGSLHKSILPILAMMKRKSIPYFRKGPLLSHIHVEDAARAILFAAERGKDGEAYNLADGKPLTSYEMFKAIAEPLGIEVRPVLPYSRRIVRAVKFIAQKMPKALYSRMTEHFSRKWEKFACQHEMKTWLKPNIDPVWLDYLAADKAYSCKKIVDAGFRFKHPDAEKGLAEMVGQYIADGLLPDGK